MMLVINQLFLFLLVGSYDQLNLFVEFDDWFCDLSANSVEEVGSYYHHYDREDNKRDYKYFYNVIADIVLHIVQLVLDYSVRKNKHKRVQFC